MSERPTRPPRPKSASTAQSPASSASPAKTQAKAPPTARIPKAAKPNGRPDVAQKVPAPTAAPPRAKSEKAASAPKAKQPKNDSSGGVETPKTRRFLVVPAWLVSLIFHLALMIVLMVVTLSEDKEEEVVSIQTTPPEMIEEIVDLEEVEFESLDELETDEISMVASEIDPGAVDFGAIANPNELEIDSSEALTLNDTSVDEIGALFGTEGEGMAAVGDGLAAAAGFFGTKAVARSVVFVVDNSNSMGAGKLETALIEMNKTISKLQPTQKFYIIFYSDTAYPLFHPKPAMKLIPATEDNKRKTAYWLESIEMCLKTKGIEAVEMARQLRPDLIYILGDGAFTDNAAKQLLLNPIERATIHTLGMQVKPKDAVDFQAIAVRHKGKYVDVGVTPEGLALFKRTGGRPKNNKKGPVWGIKLGK